MRTTLIIAAASIGAALLPIVAGTAASASTTASKGSGEPIAALNAISADASIAVGADSINTFLTPLCGTDLTEHRTASGWANTPTPTVPTCGWLDSVVTLPRHQAWAVGYQLTNTAAVRTLMEFWNGARWAIEPSPNPGSGNELHGIAATKSGTLWAVGWNDAGSLILKRSGGHWSQVKAPFPIQLQSVTVTPAGQVWAVGTEFDPDTLANATGILHLTSSGWKQVPSPSPVGANSSYLTAVTSGPHGALWAVGYYYDPSINAKPHTLTLRYSSGQWRQVTSPSPGKVADWLYAATVSSSGQVWAVGGFSGPACEHNLVLHFASGGWHQVPAPNRGTCSNDAANALYGVTVTGGNVYAVGQAGIDSLAEVGGTSGHWKLLRSAN